jgi:hypothetical protein
MHMSDGVVKDGIVHTTSTLLNRTAAQFVESLMNISW